MTCRHLGDQVGVAGCCGNDQPVYFCNHFQKICAEFPVTHKSAVQLNNGGFSWVTPQGTPFCAGCPSYSQMQNFNQNQESEGSAGQ